MGGPVDIGSEFSFGAFHCSLISIMDDTHTRAALQGLINELEEGATNQGPGGEQARNKGGVRGKFFFLPGGILCQCLVRLLGREDNRAPTNLSLAVVLG